jgi:NADH-quinone oxidoreductase subunit J
LFLFVVMMLDIDFSALRAGFIRNAPLGMLIAVVLFAEIVLGIGAFSAGPLPLGTPDGSAAALPHVSNIAAIGALLYGRYLFLFEASGLILLVAMIGAIILTHRQRGDVRGQNVSRQIARRPQDATVNMRPEVGQGVTL